MEHAIEKDRKGRIKISRLNGGQQKFRLMMIGTALFTIIGFFLLDYSGLQLWPAITGTLGNLKMMFLEPQLNQVGFGSAMYQVLVTLSLAFLSTILGAVISIFLAFGAAVNLS